MLFIIRKDAAISSKTNFIVQLLNQKSKNKVFYVFKKDNEKFVEKWYSDHVQLPSSIAGIITYYMLILLRSPEEFRNAIMKRLSIRKPKNILTGYGFLSILRRTLYMHFATSARANRLISLLNKLNLPKIFLIDELISLKCVDLKKLRLFGPVIYVSQDVAYNQYGFRNNIITRNAMFRLERDAIGYVDLIVASSEMERLKYREMGAKNAIFYPNFYPHKEFVPCRKDQTPSISIVMRDHWGLIAEHSLEIIFNALAHINRQIKVYLIGTKPPKIHKNIKLEYYKFIKSKLDYLKILSKSWIGINVGFHMAGTNERKYDYAEAGTVVFSDTLGARGDLIPYEYTYVDGHDLAAKIKQLLEFGKMRLTEMGKENRNQVLLLAEKEKKRLMVNICRITIT